MTKKKKKGIHIVGIEVRNMYRIRFARVELIPGVGLVKVTGDNGAGKTSLLRTIMAGFGGAGSVLPHALNDETDGKPGYTKIDLDNGFTIRRDVTEAAPKGYLKVVGPDEGKHTQKKLDAWLGDHHDFDVLAFFGLRPERQREILLGLGTDPELAKKLADLKTEHGVAYDRRTPHISDKRRHTAVPKPGLLPGDKKPEPIDVSAEMAKLTELQEARALRQDAYRRALRLEDGLVASRRSIGQRCETRDRVLDQSTANIQLLKDNLAEAEKSHASTIGSYAEELAGLEDAHEKQEEDARVADGAYEAMEDPTAEIEAVSARIGQAEEVARQLAPWRAWERAQEALEVSLAKVAELDGQLAAIKEKEASLISGAGIPVEGISFGEKGEPLLHGRDFALASGKDRILTSVAVAVAADPELRVCLIDEANDLGISALQTLHEQAEEHDFQIFGCRLGLEGNGEIVVDDGRAWANGYEDLLDEDLPDDAKGVRSGEGPPPEEA